MGFADSSIKSHDVEAERAIICGVEFRNYSLYQFIDIDASLDELERLANTAGAVVVHRSTQRMDSPNPKTFVGPGKAQELADACLSYSADIVIFDDELTPSQQSNLEHIVPRNVKIIDRTALILDIFALHATTREGRLQVRLAQNQYLLPRLRGMWAHLASNRMGGGVGSRFGEGESQLEVDRRMVRKRITSIKRELEQVSRMRTIQRASRYGSDLFKVSEAGYTNAGKSCLLNSLTGADVLSYDKLFATLDSTTRKLELPEGRTITITDTVGFIQKLPTNLIEAFNSTLDEIRGSDLILHVIDASSEQWESQLSTVESTLGQINAQEIPRITVFNKVDLIDGEYREVISRRFPNAVLVSAKSGEGLDELIKAIARSAMALEENIDVLIPYDNGSLVSFAHKHATVISETYEEAGTRMSLRVMPELRQRFSGFEVRGA